MNGNIEAYINEMHNKSFETEKLMYPRKMLKPNGL
jgi:hypothetical protein